MDKPHTRSDTKEFAIQKRIHNISVHSLAESDLPAADQVMRLAFGSFLRLSDPMMFTGDAAYVRARWLADPSTAFGAKLDGRIVGSNFATHWGSVGFFGPLSVHPDLWGQGIGTNLLQPVLHCFEHWGVTLAGLCTFPNSPRHISLYQRYGFWPRFLTALMTKDVTLPEIAIQRQYIWTCYEQLPISQREIVIEASRELTDEIYEGLDVQLEIRAVATNGLGDTVLLWDRGENAKLLGIAVCHCDSGTETSKGTCYIKFGAVRPNANTAETFVELLSACQEFATSRQLIRIEAGINTSHHEAYEIMCALGFHPDEYVVVMHRDNKEGYNLSDRFVIDDWR